MVIVSKFESKGSKSLDFLAYSVFKDFDQRNFMLLATLHPKMAIDFGCKHLESKICHICSLTVSKKI